jgi:hypothetical protein
MSMRTRCVPCLLYHHGICTALAPREAPHFIGDVKTTFFKPVPSRSAAGPPGCLSPKTKAPENTLPITNLFCLWRSTIQLFAELVSLQWNSTPSLGATSFYHRAIDLSPRKILCAFVGCPTWLMVSDAALWTLRRRLEAGRGIYKVTSRIWSHPTPFEARGILRVIINALLSCRKLCELKPRQ